MNETPILSYLKRNACGRKKAVTAFSLCVELGLSENELRRSVNHLRRESVPVGSSSNGYFYCVTAADVYTTIRHLKRMSAGLDAAICGLEDSLDGFGAEAVKP